jgi:hypothetical protein
MDLENKALVEAFNKKYGMTPAQRKTLGITDEDYAATKERFAKHFYGQETKQEEPSMLEKAKKGLSEWYDWNFARRPKS